MSELFQLHYQQSLWILALPALMAAADILTGLAQAQVNGKKNSSVMRKGFYRKLGELGAILLTWIVCIALNLGDAIPTAASIYIVFMEALSIMENLQALGVPIPSFITRKAKQVAEELDEGKKYEEKH